MIYTFRKKPHPKHDWVEIAKFAGHDQPEDTYDVIDGSCNCPGGYRGNCKHLRMVECWKEQVQEALPSDPPIAWDDEKNEFIELPFDGKLIEELLNS